MERAGAWWSPGEPGAAAGPLTSPHRQPRSLGGGEGGGRGCAPSRFPPGSPSAATWRRHGQSPPSRVRPSSRVVSAAKPTRQRWKHRRHLIVKEGAPRSRRPLQPLLLPPLKGRAIPLESPPADGLYPSPQKEENIWLKPFFNPAGFEGLDGDGKPVKCSSQVPGAPRGPRSPRRHLRSGRNALNLSNDLALTRLAVPQDAGAVSSGPAPSPGLRPPALVSATGSPFCSPFASARPSAPFPATTPAFAARRDARGRAVTKGGLP